MKKILSFVFMLFFGIICVMSIFSCNTKKSANALGQSSGSFKEENLTNRFEIIDATTNVYAGSEAVLNQSLFDYSTKSLRPGYVVFPTTKGANKEVEASYICNEFSVLPDESIYVWIFIPDEATYDLKISFTNSAGDELSWQYDAVDLRGYLELSKRGGFVCGWRLFEFCVSDAYKSNNVQNDLTGSRFNIFTIAYLNPGTYIVTENHNKFGFFGVFKADSCVNQSRIAHGQDYTISKISDNFANYNNFFIDEEIEFVSVKDTFDYLIAGQNDLRNYPNDNYYWEINLIDSDGKPHPKNFGDNNKYIFEKQGYHIIEFTLKEVKDGSSKTILFTSLDINIDYYVIGGFTNVDYSVDINNTLKITFEVSRYFKNTSDIVVSLDDKTFADVTYYIQGKMCFIEITGVKEGETKVVVQADSLDPGTGESKTYKCSTAIKITNSGKKPASEITLWVILGIYGTCFATFLVISLVKARRFSVK